VSARPIPGAERIALSRAVSGRRRRLPAWRRYGWLPAILAGSALAAGLVYTGLACLLWQVVRFIGGLH
jgi:hypothetical protein